MKNEITGHSHMPRNSTEHSFTIRVTDNTAFGIIPLVTIYSSTFLDEVSMRSSVENVTILQERINNLQVTIQDPLDPHCIYSFKTQSFAFVFQEYIQYG